MAEPTSYAQDTITKLFELSEGEKAKQAKLEEEKIKIVNYLCELANSEEFIAFLAKHNEHITIIEYETGRDWFITSEGIVELGIKIPAVVDTLYNKLPHGKTLPNGIIWKPFLNELKNSIDEQIERLFKQYLSS